MSTVTKVWLDETENECTMCGACEATCPVGAITSRDYRFKSRPWDNPQAVDTICTQCSKGCNVTAWIKAKLEWAKGSRLIRMTPRFTPARRASKIPIGRRSICSTAHWKYCSPHRW